MCCFFPEYLDSDIYAEIPDSPNDTESKLKKKNLRN